MTGKSRDTMPVNGQKLNMATLVKNKAVTLVNTIPFYQIGFSLLIGQ